MIVEVSKEEGFKILASRVKKDTTALKEAEALVSEGKLEEAAAVYDKLQGTYAALLISSGDLTGNLRIAGASSAVSGAISGGAILGGSAAGGGAILGGSANLSSILLSSVLKTKDDEKGTLNRKEAVDTANQIQAESVDTSSKK